ncbi:MAG: SDR family NAD(P)-dependent oxidoreductase [Desulfobacterales bacterium]|nr:SDR family NAD(P)-dependent oxidoreductase [Desulfobacterales bacterium]
MIDSLDEDKLNLKAIQSNDVNNPYHDISYKELKDYIEIIGNVLIETGVEKGDKIGLLSENRTEWAIIYLAVCSIGAIIVPFDIFLKPYELTIVISKSEISMLFTSDLFIKNIKNNRSKLNKLKKIICFGKKKYYKESKIKKNGSEYLNFDDLYKNGKNLSQKGTKSYNNVVVNANDIAVTLFVSNKIGVMLSHKAIMSNVFDLFNIFKFKRNLIGKWLAIVPLSHTFPTSFGILLPILTHSSTIYLSTSRINQIVKAIKEYKINYVTMVPLLVERFYKYIKSNIKNKQFSLKEHGLDSLKCLFVAGAPLSKFIIDEMESFGIEIIEGYGLTETGPCISFNSFVSKKAGSVGQLLGSVQVRIYKPDESGNGEIIAKGPNVMAGYFKMPKNSHGCIDGRISVDNEGWAHTGDIGRFDKSGFLYITGRSRNIIVTKGGSNIYSKELEELLIQSDYISDVIITRKIEEKVGERPHAVIYPEWNTISKKNGNESIEKHVQSEFEKRCESIANFKVPDTFEIIYEKEKFDAIRIKNDKSRFSTLRSLIDNEGVNKDVDLEKNIPVTDNVYQNLKEQTVKLEIEVHKYISKKLLQILDETENSISSKRNIMDLGLESIELLKIAEAIEEDLNIDFDPTLFFEYQNIKELVEYFVEKFPQKLSKVFNISEFKDNYITSIKNKSEIVIDSGVCKSGKDIGIIPIEQPDDDECLIQEESSKDIAIIGMNGRFAEAAGVEEFWNNLCDNKDLIKEIPTDHWDYRPWFDENVDAKDKTYCKWGSFIDGVDKFDADFFNISPREAEWMDPQIRLMLQCIYGTGEDAGYINQMRGSDTGVFVGVCFHDYADKISELNLPVDPYIDTGNRQTIVANRASFIFDFTGPSIAYDTACSSSLFALHHACSALRNKECKMAFAAGVNLLLSSYHYRYFSSIGALSPTGRCHSFDKAADGYVPAECVAGVLLKPLNEAIKDDDRIYAIIKGSAALHGGYTSSLTAPSVSGEENVILKAWADAGINPETISYIEAHGTGTKLGDPIEINSLKKAFGKFTQKENFCAIGSAKANIGHAEGAAGIVGLIKVIQQIKYKKIPSMFTYKTLNPYIKLENSPFYINQEIEDWKTFNNIPRRAGISSFGFSGAYAHVVIEEFNNVTKAQNYNEVKLNKPQIFVLSAKNEIQLKEYVKKMVVFLEKENQSISEIAYTSQVCREPMEERFAVIVETIRELQKKLRDFLDEKDVDDLFRGQVKRNKETFAVFDADEDMMKTIDAWFAKGKYRKLLHLWVKGLNFDWNKLYGETKPRKISIPTYPFAKERYWITDIGVGKQVVDTNISEKNVQKFDIDLCDENGKICMETSKVLEDKNSSTASNIEYETLMLKKSWEEHSVDSKISIPEYTQHLVFFCESDNISFKDIESELNGVNCILLESKQKEIENRFQNYAVQLFEKIQTILNDKPKGRVLMQGVVSATKGENHLFSGLSGLFKTARIENPKLICQLIETDTNEDMVKKLEESSKNPNDSQIRYINSKRLIVKWNEVKMSQEDVGLPWKDYGVYLITGGAGDLGQIFAKEILAKVKDTTLILTGRSELGEDKRVRLKELESLGSRIDYRQVDVTSKESVISLMQNIQEEFGKLDGIIHSAGIIRDNFILKKNREEFEKVLAPKVTGLVNLDEASKNIPLDFFILFSSIAGGMGNIGQADYACANAFMDVYAGYRNNLVSSNVRHGKTLSINWPLWKNGGMSIDKETEKMMMQSMGMISMQTISGIQAFYKGLVSGHNQLMVMEGDIQMMREHLFNAASKIYENQTNPSAPQVDLKLLKEKTVHKIKALFAEVTKINVSQIDIEEPLESYGINSVMITMLNKNLEDIFSGISKTLFFEYQTLEALSEYFISDHKHECFIWAGLRGDILNLSRKSSEKKYDISEFPALVSLKAGKKIDRNYTAKASFGKREPIAIIGISGRFPQAKTLNEYWENLKAGKDCITEIPKERWSLNGFYHSDQKEATEKWKSYSKWGGFIEEFSEFDPLFFKMSPRESMNIDPQERLFIKSCWEVMEDAGYTQDQLTKQYNNRVGVFAGITKTGFDLYGPDLLRQGEDMYPRTSFSSLANRVSYLLNLHGPSMPVDTMCSASLTAIHEACEHIHMGECEMAIAGGVNLYLHPSSYFLLCSQQMLSTDGKCKSFGLGGNGFVPGEGVGTVLLKCLSQAEKDQDNIYAVIRGSGINHGGKTNGYTVPNPTAQAELIRTTIEKAGVDARSISYIEAHGTGTSLGDPIEINGLSKAFQKDTKDVQFCAIGSVKSNIGHCESAAGIAGVAKVVLQLKNQKLVPSLHSESLNPNIDFSKTPFVVQQELTEWKRPVINGHEVARCAGVSSFGAGGSNAHVVIEEYLSKEVSPQIVISDNNPAIIVLSTKNEENLKVQAKQLLEAIAKKEFPDASLPDIAYTLQVGREAMEERLAMSVANIKELEEKLNGFLENRDDIEGIYRGQVKGNKDAISVFAADEELQEAIEKWIKRKKYTKLLNLWVKGLFFDWNKLYDYEIPNRISLPTYPFTRERYWLPENITSTNNMAGKGIVSFLHPLLHQNTSTFEKQRYSSTFTGEEFFFTLIMGQRILPEVACLEMVHAAIESSMGERNVRIRFENMVWGIPITVGDKAVQVNLGLFPEDNGVIAYEIYCDSGEEDIVVFNQGNAILCKDEDTTTIDIKAIQEECNQTILSSAKCYEAFKSIGIEYGLGHQGIEKLHIGKNQVISKLSLPPLVSDTKDQYVLHPSMLDSTLQSSIGFMLGSVDIKNNAQGKPSLPFAVKELEILSNCTANMWAWLRYSTGSISDDNFQKLDIDLCDEDGNICVRMKGFTSRVLESEIQTNKKLKESYLDDPIKHLVGTVIQSPVWDTILLEKNQIFPSLTAQVIIVGGTKENRVFLQQYYPNARILENNSTDTIEILAQKLEKNGFIDHIIWIAPYKSLETLADDSIIEEQNEGVLKCFRMIKALLQSGYGTRNLGWSLITTQSQSIRKNDTVSPGQSSLHGLIGSMAKEYQNWKIRLVDLEDDSDWSVADIFTLPTNKQGDLLVYRNQQWYQQQLIPVNYPSIHKTLYKYGGVYVVIGGAGGIGEVWSEYMIRTYNVQIIWIGRRKKDSVIQAKLDRLAAIGSLPIYIAADATNKKALGNAYEEIKKQHSNIHGVIHSAIVLLDKSLANMKEEQFRAALSAKVDVSVRIAQVFQAEPLDFILFFSSMQSFSKMPGQSNYAAGCTFKDAFAHQLSHETSGVVKVINWGYWGSVGIVATKDYQDRMAQAGIGSIEPEEAMKTLEMLVSGNIDQIGLMKLSKPLIQDGVKADELLTVYPENNPSAIQNMQILISNDSKPKKELNSSNSAIGINNTVEYMETSLKQNISRIIKVEQEDIDVDIDLIEYGFDQIMHIEFINNLNEEYKLKLAHHTLLEYPTINRLTKYIMKNYNVV